MRYNAEVASAAAADNNHIMHYASAVGESGPRRKQAVQAPGWRWPVGTDLKAYSIRKTAMVEE